MLRVKDYRIENAIDPEDKKEKVCADTPVDIQASRCAPKTGDNEMCRFCHAEEHTNENPLLSICNCTGSLRFVHFKCLKVWLNFKLATKKQAYLTSYFWKSFECEICKLQYPGIFFL